MLADNFYLISLAVVKLFFFNLTPLVANYQPLGTSFTLPERLPGHHSGAKSLLLWLLQSHSQPGDSNFPTARLLVDSWSKQSGVSADVHHCAHKHPTAVSTTGAAEGLRDMRKAVLGADPSPPVLL